MLLTHRTGLRRLKQISKSWSRSTAPPRILPSYDAYGPSTAPTEDAVQTIPQRRPTRPMSAERTPIFALCRPLPASAIFVTILLASLSPWSPISSTRSGPRSFSVRRKSRSALSGVDDNRRHGSRWSAKIFSPPNGRFCRVTLVQSTNRSENRVQKRTKKNQNAPLACFFAPP